MENFKATSPETYPSNHSLNFNKENINLLLSLTPSNSVPEMVLSIVNRENLTQKNEFHSTIIGRETGDLIVSMLNNLSTEERSAIISKIEKLSNEFTWTYTPKEEYLFILKVYGPDDTRKSIIQIINLPDLQPFYTKLNELLGTCFAIPFPHITLFTTSTREDKKLRGIGIYSEEDLISLNPIKIEV